MDMNMGKCGFLSGRALLIGLVGVAGLGAAQAQQGGPGFQILDRNHDGFLSPNELGAGVARGVGAAVSMRADQNGDGKITEDEFLSIPRQQFRAALNKFDKDDDGALSQDEINQASGVGFHQMDTNNDGRVSLAEWNNAKHTAGRRALGQALFRAGQRMQSQQTEGER